tara:strand:- start:3060 stop:3329 length:270 start_codon:yes stop_codon:yes gene_type:complete
MLKPVNRYILIEIEEVKKDREPLIVLPEDYKAPEPTHAAVKCLAYAKDVRFDLSVGASIVIDRSMLEQISIDGTIYNMILDNYVVAILE